MASEEAFMTLGDSVDRFHQLSGAHPNLSWNEDTPHATGSMRMASYGVGSSVWSIVAESELRHRSVMVGQMDKAQPKRPDGDFIVSAMLLERDHEQSAVAVTPVMDIVSGLYIEEDTTLPVFTPVTNTMLEILAGYKQHQGGREHYHETTTLGWLDRNDAEGLADFLSLAWRIDTPHRYITRFATEEDLRKGSDAAPFLHDQAQELYDPQNSQIAPNVKLIRDPSTQLSRQVDREIETSVNPPSEVLLDHQFHLQPDETDEFNYILLIRNGNSITILNIDGKYPIVSKLEVPMSDPLGLENIAPHNVVMASMRNRWKILTNEQIDPYIGLLMHVPRDPR